MTRSKNEAKVFTGVSVDEHDAVSRAKIVQDRSIIKIRQICKKDEKNQKNESLQFLTIFVDRT